jgi:transposase
MPKEIALVEIKKAIKLLPKERRRIFILYYIKGVSNEAIGKKLNIGVQTVKNQESRAYSKARVIAGFACLQQKPQDSTDRAVIADELPAQPEYTRVV